VVSRFLRDLAAHADRLAGAQAERVLADLTDLVVVLLGDRVHGSEAVGSSLQRALLARSTRPFRNTTPRFPSPPDLP
jgi:hypothetical protein